ncbi:putative quinol oxidase subunit 1 [compost metagenome]
MGGVFFVAGLFLVFELHILALIVTVVGIFGGLIARSFDYDEGFHIHKDEIKRTEKAWRSVEGEVSKYGA